MDTSRYPYAEYARMLPEPVRRRYAIIAHGNSKPYARDCYFRALYNKEAEPSATL